MTDAELTVYGIDNYISKLQDGYMHNFLDKYIQDSYISSFHDNNIYELQDALSSLPPSSHFRATLLSLLARERLDRFHLSHDKEDLEKSILQLTLAIFLPFPVSTEDNPNIISTLYFLSRALIHRSFKYNRPRDVGFSIKFLRLLRDLQCTVSDDARTEYTISLVHALCLHARLERGNAVQDAEEMSILCRELLSSDPSEPGIYGSIDSLAEAVIISLSLSYQLNRYPQQIIECLREATRCLPDSPIACFALFQYFDLRFWDTKSKDDYENAMEFLGKTLASHSSTNNMRRRTLHEAAGLAHDRFRYYGNPEDLEEAIIRYRAVRGSKSLEDSDRSAITQSLAELADTRFDEFGVTCCLANASSSLIVESAIDPPSFADLAESLAGSSANESLSMTVEDLLPHLEVLGDMDLITDEAEIEEAVEYCRLLHASLRKRGDKALSMTYLAFSMLGNFFRHAYEQTNKPAYINEAIDIFQGILKVERAQWLHFSIIQQLLLSLGHRRKLFKDKRDFDEIMRLFSIATTDTYTKVPDRFEVSCEWAHIARKSQDPSAPAAYESAISLMQDTLTFAPTLEIQHYRLVTVAIREDIEKLPLEYASYQISKGQIEEAIVTLERGRGLMWSELRGLRTSIDQLCGADLSLAEKFAAINEKLEDLTTSGSEDFVSYYGDDDRGEEMDSFGRTVVNQRKLLDERTSLIEQIRSLPGFGDFLMAHSFEKLRSAAAHGPVIIINHCHWRSDIIILLSHSPPSLITTEDNFYERAKGLKEQLLAERKEDVGSKAYEETLTFVLKSLYDLVGRPVIQRLQELNIPEQSRIWWCPTSDFCSLPLHAMGPVRSDGGYKLYFSDLYIPSYTPTLSALIESRKPGSQSFEKPSILLVAQPDKSMPNARREIAQIRSKTAVTLLSSERAIPSAVRQRLHDHRFAHFSCHGILSIGKPFDAAFKLFQGELLTLLEIIRSRLPSAEFAFLSACHTAELTEESIANEGLHLAAAVQYSGFRSVVGTMWAVADIDGPFLVKRFYASLFSETQQDVPYYERAAVALRDSVTELRKKGVNTERWVNFVHYGA